MSSTATTKRKSSSSSRAGDAETVSPEKRQRQASTSILQGTELPFEPTEERDDLERGKMRNNHIHKSVNPYATKPKAGGVASRPVPTAMSRGSPSLSNNPSHTPVSEYMDNKTQQALYDKAIYDMSTDEESDGEKPAAISRAKSIATAEMDHSEESPDDCFFQLGEMAARDAEFDSNSTFPERHVVANTFHHDDLSSIPSHSSHFAPQHPPHKRIVEVLAENLAARLRMAPPVHAKASSLVRHDAFFVEGLRIEWPFPQVMTPQRQMAMHILRGLRNRKHVVLESPTGTGKSAAILCSVLAFQQQQQQKKWKLQRATQEDTSETTKTKATTAQSSTHTGGRNNSGSGHDTVRIIYCTRTHSQVTQLVASLRKTSYRPRMTVLGSRDRLCIHKTLLESKQDQGSNSNNKTKKALNLNQECRKRCSNTEKQRRSALRQSNRYYNDDDPPSRWTDDQVSSERPEHDSDVEVVDADGNPADMDDGENSARPSSHHWIDKDSTSVPTCKHYRDLTATRVAAYAYDQLTPSNTDCQCGGEKSKLGTHDVEDLVAFGKAPHVRRNVAVYRRRDTTSFGMTIGRSSTKVDIVRIKDDSASRDEGSLRKGQEIVNINGKAANKHKSIAEVVQQIDSSPDPMLLDVTNRSDNSLSPCPYHLSRALAAKADLIFMPYNYLLDPSVRERMKIPLGENTVVILDEAHNVEDVLRGAGSGTFGEFDLAHVLVMLDTFSRTDTETERKYNKTIQKDTRSWEDDKDGNTEEESDKGFCDMAHDLLLFVEDILNVLKDDMVAFQSSEFDCGKPSSASCGTVYVCLCVCVCAF